MPRLIKTNGSFFPQDPPSPFILPAGNPIAEAAWSIGSEKGKQQLAITRDEAVRMGLDPDTMYRYPAGFGRGLDGQYPVRLDIFHQLHCLNMLRKAANPDVFKAHFHSQQVGNRTLSWAEHVQHCQYALFQMLTCQPDWAVLGFFSVEGTDPGPKLDFSVERKCIDWEAFMRWRKEHAMEFNDEEWRKIHAVAPKGSIVGSD